MAVNAGNNFPLLIERETWPCSKKRRDKHSLFGTLGTPTHLREAGLQGRAASHVLPPEQNVPFKSYEHSLVY